MPTPEPGNPDTRKYQMSEAALGGADAVEKTSYVTGRGTDPNAHTIAGVSARTSSGGGVNLLGWAVGAVAVVIGLVYVLGMMR